jgi:hypothetical protein
MMVSNVNSVKNVGIDTTVSKEMKNAKEPSANTDALQVVFHVSTCWDRPK